MKYIRNKILRVRKSRKNSRIKSIKILDIGIIRKKIYKISMFNYFNKRKEGFKM